MSQEAAVPTEQPGGWREHSRPNVGLRRKKARKIISLIDRARPVDGAQVLEIGTGAGVISAELARAVGADGTVTSIDTMDTRLDPAGYDFCLTSGVGLGFDDASFDVVVSNHVIEHVGGRVDQRVHVTEIARVLRPCGLAYLATPTRWSIIEPHFKVPFVSCLPRGWRNRYIQLMRAGRVYDVDPYGRRELTNELRRTGLPVTDATLDALTVLGQVEGSRGVVGLLLRSPRWVRRAVRPVLPTMVFLVERPAA